MKAPRQGEDVSTLYVVRALLMTGQQLGDVERSWLVKLLDAAASGEDVSARFTANKKPSPEAERHFWIALDYREHVQAKRGPAARKVAERWGMKGHAAEETVERIADRQKADVAKLLPIIGDIAAVIEANRIRLVGHKST